MDTSSFKLWYICLYLYILSHRSFIILASFALNLWAKSMQLGQVRRCVPWYCHLHAVLDTRCWLVAPMATFIKKKKSQLLLITYPTSVCKGEKWCIQNISVLYVGSKLHQMNTANYDGKVVRHATITIQCIHLAICRSLSFTHSF